jgi:hypothetical protein
MQITISKLAALLLALGYTIAAWLSADGWPFAVTVAVGTLLPLALIWFPEEIDDWIRLWRRGGRGGLQMRPSPAWLLATMGWVFLLALPLFLLLRRRS